MEQGQDGTGWERERRERRLAWAEAHIAWQRAQLDYDLVGRRTYAELVAELTRTQAPQVALARAVAETDAHPEVQAARRRAREAFEAAERARAEWEAC